MLNKLKYGTYMLASLLPMKLMAQNADVTGALETNQEALDAAQNSKLTASDAQSFFQSGMNIFLMGAGLVGVIMVAFGVYKLWDHNKQGDQARGGTGGYWAMIVFGGLMTIVSVLAAFVVNVVLNGAA